MAIWRGEEAKAKGRCADFKDPATRFLLIAEAHTVQLYKIVGMKFDLYSNEILLSDTIHLKAF